MKTVRPLLLAVLGLALLSACSQVPESIQGLEPQFGKVGYDGATKVATNAAHPYAFVVGSYGSVKEGQQDKNFLRSFTRNGSLRWERLIPIPVSAEFSYTADVVTDAAGNVYLAYNIDTNPDPFEDVYENHLAKFDKDGKQIWNRVLNDDVVGPLALDARGNIYAATNGFVSNLYKYAPNGKIIWESDVQPDFSIYELVVSDRDELFVMGDDYSRYDLNTGQGYIRRVLRKHDSEYRLKFERSFARDSSVYGMAVGGSSVYVAYGNEGSPGVPINVKRYSTSGKLLLKRALKTGAEDYTGVRGVSADSAGNLYLAGFIASDNPDSTNPYDTYEDDLFVTKYSPSLVSKWTYRTDLSGTYSVAFDVTPRTTGEIYAAGRSNGKINGKNNGSSDAFLLRLDSKGQKVWIR